MGWKPWKKNLSSSLILQAFYVISITTLTLLLPLSFLILSRLSNSYISNPFLLFSTNPTILHILVSIITILSLFHTLTGRITHLSTQTGRPGLKVSWAFLCSVQVCVILGIQASTESESGFGSETGSDSEPGLGLFCKAVFFLGVHETMMCWNRIVVRPVVDDAVWGGDRAETWSEKAAITAGCVGLWWLRLREEVEALVGAVERIEGGIGDFVGWWLYYLTVSIGIARVLKGFFWVGIRMIVFFKRFEDAICISLAVEAEEQV